jgi:hypothetical protein
MAQIAPPLPPLRVTLADPDGAGYLHGRLWLVSMTLLTVLITAWLCCLGPIPAIIALVVAKHILVAFLVMGLDLRAHYQAQL